MIRCDLFVVLTVLVSSLGPGHHVLCDQHTNQRLWHYNPVSLKSFESPMSTNEVHVGSNDPLFRDGRALRRRNRNQRRRSRPDESILSKSIVEDNYYNPLEEDYEYYDDEEVLQRTVDPGSRRQGQHAASLPMASVGFHSKEPVPPHHEIESGQYDSYQPSQKTSPLPGFLKTLAACVPLSLVAAAIPLGVANFGGASSTVTINPSPVTITITMSITQMTMDEVIIENPNPDEVLTFKSGGDIPLEIGSQLETSSVTPETQSDKKQRTRVPSSEATTTTTTTTTTTFTNNTKTLKAQPRLSSDIVKALFTPRDVGTPSSMESILNLTDIDEKGEVLGNKDLLSVESTWENNKNDVISLPLVNQLSGNWTFDDPDDTSNLIVSKVEDEMNPAELVRLNTQEVKDTMVISEELNHEDISNLQVQSNIVRKVHQNTSPKPVLRSRLPRLDLKNWAD